MALIAGKQMETGPAEEDFSWACGHCFFERRKKFAIKDYLIRQVCRKSIASKKSRGQAGRAKLKRHLSCDCAREKDIEITSWLVSAYDFYSRVVKNRKRTSERSERVSLRFFTTSE